MSIDNKYIVVSGVPESATFAASVQTLATSRTSNDGTKYICKTPNNNPTGYEGIGEPGIVFGPSDHAGILSWLATNAAEWTGEGL